MPTLREVGEVELIRRLARARGASREDRRVVIGSGDDAAVLRPRAGYDLVATTDAFVEGVHYLPEWQDASALGRRLAVANLSDLAAMSAAPSWAMLAIGVRGDHDVDALIAVQSAFAEALAEHAAVVVGGNVTAVRDAEWWSVSLIGEAERGRVWTRHGARPGDLVAVTGWPGRAGAGARLARALGEGARAPEWREPIDAWSAPASRVRFAQALAAAAAVTAAIDISDGIAGDLAQLAHASGVGAELRESSWPEDAVLARAAAALKTSVDTLRFGASDDYELLLAIDPAGRARCEEIAAREGVPLHVVGVLNEASGVFTWQPSAGTSRVIEPGGYDHFG